MSRRKGEMTPASVDSGWPHQVALAEEHCTGASFHLHRAFCSEQALALCPRGHTVRHSDQWFHVFCFAERAHAEAFMARFGGEWFDPRDRGRGGAWARWHKDGSHRPGPHRRARCDNAAPRRSEVHAMPYESEAELDAALRETLRQCEGDAVAAVRALLVANAFLEEEVARLGEAVSRGYARRDPRRQRATGKSREV